MQLTKNKKLLIIFACFLTVILLGVILFFIFKKDENSEIKYIRKAYISATLNNCYGYSQTVNIKNGDLSYDCYIKDFLYDGVNIKIYEKETTLNSLEQDDSFSSSETIKYISDNYLIENVNGFFTKTEQVEMDINFGYKIYENLIKEYTFQEIENEVYFSAKIKESKYAEFLQVDLNNISNLNFKAKVIDGKLIYLNIYYNTANNSQITISNVVHYEKQTVNLPNLEN